jgi:hypothetical protein
MSSLPEEAFRRAAEAPDEEFYRTPRLVTHIDDRAISAVTQLYRERFPPRSCGQKHRTLQQRTLKLKRTTSASR